MHVSRPSTGTILGALALFVALGGTAVAATATIVNIADPTTPAHVAHVDASGKLQVGGGPISVNGTVTDQLAAPSAFLHSFNNANGGAGCVVLATPPAGNAMIVRDVRIDVWADPSPGAGQDILIFTGTTCSNLVGDVNPPSVGETVLPFDPGLAVPAGSGISMAAGGSVRAEGYIDGYSVPSTSVPAAPPNKGKTVLPQQR